VQGSGKRAGSLGITEKETDAIQMETENITMHLDVMMCTVKDA
jgi:hypothetical protein